MSHMHSGKQWARKAPVDQIPVYPPQLQLLSNNPRSHLLQALSTGKFVTPVGAGEVTYEDPSAASGEGSATEAQEEEVATGDPGSVLEVKHLDEVLDSLTGKWNTKPTPKGSDSSSHKKRDKYDAYAFTVVRRFTPGPAVMPGAQSSYTVSRWVVIHSPELTKVGTTVIGHVQGVSWTARPLRVSPQVLLSWLPELREHLKTLSSDEDSPTRATHSHLSHLIDWLATEYAEALETLDSLLEHSEITFNLIWALLVPRKTILYLNCPTTSEPRAVRLVHAEKCQKTDMGAPTAAFDTTGLSINFDTSNPEDNSKFLYRLVVEYLEVDVSSQGAQYGYAGLGAVIDIPGFVGTKKISSLGVYPIKYYSGPGGLDGLKERLVTRGKKWLSLSGAVNHRAYKGLAYKWVRSGPEQVRLKHSVDSRIMIDRRTFADNMPNYDKMTYVSKSLSGRDIDRHALRTAYTDDSQGRMATIEELTDDLIMLTPPNLYGFSLADKEWLEFNVEVVQTFEWNVEAYENLVIPPDQKAVLTTLVEAHTSESAAKVDDFVRGKGLGLVINLYGNPGTGKSLTAEAMSEHLHKPLYVVGAADLGTAAPKVDSALSSILKISATWGAVVLIDEADVFLEERALHHIERNAMVAVFLRHLEYFRGILFLTTNRVRVFDEAFQSRIHISLRYHDLTAESRRKIWVAFLRKVHDHHPEGGLSREELRTLGEKKINGRQIKNVVKTATALAIGRQEVLGYRHLLLVLDMMDQFDASHAMYN